MAKVSIVTGIEYIKQTMAREWLQELPDQVKKDGVMEECELIQHCMDITYSRGRHILYGMRHRL